MQVATLGKSLQELPQLDGLIFQSLKTLADWLCCPVTGQRKSGEGPAA
jgi:hypothetical protein